MEQDSVDTNVATILRVERGMFLPMVMGLANSTLRLRRISSREWPWECKSTTRATKP